MTTPAISVNAVSKRFRIPLDKSTTLKYRITHLRSSGRYYRLDALHDITFDVATGEFLGIIGSNGCGKSTLLKIIAGIYVPSAGSVAINGRVSPFLELGVGFNPELTARENVFVNGAVLGLTRTELQERFDSIIDFAGLHDFVDQKLKNFSSGMQVRLAFSVAIQARAEILLMDEVLAVGDAEFQEKCFDVFWRYKREGKTVVLVTHDLASVENYCDRAIWIDHGRILANGPAPKVTTRYRRNVEALMETASTAPGHDDGDSDAAGSKRFGSGEIVLNEIRLVDAFGKRLTAVESGAGLAIELEFESRAADRDLVFGIALHRADGLFVGGSDSRAAGLNIRSPQSGQRGCISFAVERLPLVSGSYLISASIRDRHTQHVFDDIQQAIPFRVKSETNASGLIGLDGHWVAD